MAFRINSSINPLEKYNNSISQNSKLLNQSLQRLATGVKVKDGSDDSAGLTIADGLRVQRYSLLQGIKNSNEGIAIAQIADKGIDGEIKLLDLIKTKAIQASQDGQSMQTKKALQADITKLIDALDLMSDSTMYNGYKLLSGDYQNKRFHYGIPINQTINLSIASTKSDRIGSVRFETGTLLTSASADQDINLKFIDYNGVNDLELKSAKIGVKAGEGIGVLANVINEASNLTKIRANWNLLESASSSVISGDISGLTLNGVVVGTISAISENDSDGKLTNAINQVKNSTGIEAFLINGKLNLKSLDGRGIQISGANLATVANLRSDDLYNFGRLTLTKLGASDITISGTNSNLAGFDNINEAQATLKLNDMKFDINSSVADAIGAYANSNQNDSLGAGVTSLAGAMALIDISESALKELSKIRASIGSTQNEFSAMINSLSVTTVNLAAVESQIRDVDYAEESLNFQKRKILVESGNFALYQMNGLSNMQATVTKLFSV